jgi:hypothetical protein
MLSYWLKVWYLYEEVVGSKLHMQEGMLSWQKQVQGIGDVQLPQETLTYEDQMPRP